MSWNYIDVYNRQVMRGDVVLCAYYTYAPQFSPIEVRYCTLVTVGDEQPDITVGPKVESLICYKITDKSILSNVNKFTFYGWEDYYKQFSRGFTSQNYAYEGTVFTQMCDMLQRTIKPGDFVIYKLNKTKPNYGIVIDNNNILTESGKINKVNHVLVLNDLTAKENEIRNKLYKKYQEFQMTRISTKILKSVKEIKSGEVYLSKDNKHLSLYLSNCGYTIKLKKYDIQTVSPMYDSFLIYCTNSTKVAKEIVEKFNVGKEVTIYDFLKGLKANSLYQLYTPWDSKFMDKLLSTRTDNTFKNTTWQDNSVALQIYGDTFLRTKCLHITDSKVRKGDSILGCIKRDKQVIFYENDVLQIILNIA